jgi:hypothetical protein
VQVRLLIGRNAGQVVDMPYDRAVANRELGHVEFVSQTVDPPRPLALMQNPVVVEPVAPRRRGRPPVARRVE